MWYKEAQYQPTSEQRAQGLAQGITFSEDGNSAYNYQSIVSMAYDLYLKNYSPEQVAQQMSVVFQNNPDLQPIVQKAIQEAGVKAGAYNSEVIKKYSAQFAPIQQLNEKLTSLVEQATQESQGNFFTNFTQSGRLAGTVNEFTQTCTAWGNTMNAVLSQPITDVLALKHLYEKVIVSINEATKFIDIIQKKQENLATNLSSYMNSMKAYEKTILNMYQTLWQNQFGH